MIDFTKPKKWSPRKRDRAWVMDPKIKWNEKCYYCNMCPCTGFQEDSMRNLVDEVKRHDRQEQ